MKEKTKYKQGEWKNHSFVAYFVSLMNFLTEIHLLCCARWQEKIAEKERKEKGERKKKDDKWLQ